MTRVRSRPVSLRDAARTIFGVDAPDEEQVHKVWQKMKSGALPALDSAGPPGNWTTSEDALAEYMAQRMTRHHDAARGGRSSATSGALCGVYRGIWREYFLAVLMRRRVRHRSAWFRRAVLAGQVAVLGTTLLVTAAVVRSAGGPNRVEHAAIEAWLAENTDSYQVVRWHPPRPAPRGQGKWIEVDYAYFGASQRRIVTSRTFEVEGDTVREVSFE